jgi:hypothetical protein
MIGISWYVAKKLSSYYTIKIFEFSDESYKDVVSVKNHCFRNFFSAFNENETKI